MTINVLRMRMYAA